MVGTGTLIAVAKLSNISVFHAGEVLVQLLIKILPVAVPQGNAEAEVHDDLHPCRKAIIQQTLEILPNGGIINEWFIDKAKAKKFYKPENTEVDEVIPIFKTQDVLYDVKLVEK